MIIGYSYGNIHKMSSEVPRPTEKPSHCIFDDMLKGKAEVAIVARNSRAWALVSLEGHVIILPTRHLTVDDVIKDPRLMEPVYELAYSILEPVRDVLGAEGITMVVNIGKSAGQEFEHMHVHLIDRQRGDRKVRFRDLPRMSIEERRTRASGIASRITSK